MKENMPTFASLSPRHRALSNTFQTKLYNSIVLQLKQISLCIYIQQFPHPLIWRWARAMIPFP